MGNPDIIDARAAAPGWRDVAWPREHGSWSLALEPLVLGVLAVPSAAGVGLAVAGLAGFFMRRPLRIFLFDSNQARRLAACRALIGCAMLVLAGLGFALRNAGASWSPWLLPSAVAGIFFLIFDLRKAGREQSAEIAGTVAFSWLPSVFAAVAAEPAGAAASLGLVMLARSVPTVLVVRASLRARKTGKRQIAVPLLAAAAALPAVSWLCVRGQAPWIAALMSGVLALRSIALLLFVPRSVRASTIGIAEAVLGAVYVVGVAIAWRA